MDEKKLTTAEKRANVERVNAFQELAAVMTTLDTQTGKASA